MHNSGGRIGIFNCVPSVIVVAQSLSCVWLFVTPRTAACWAYLFLTISLSLFKFMSIKSVMPSSHLIRCHPLLLLLSIFPSTGSQLNILFPLQDGLPWWLSWSRICLQCRRQGFDCWVGKICGVGNGNPWTEENSMDRGAWQATVYGVAKSWTQLSNKHATGWKQEKLKNKAGTTTWQLRQSLESSS